MEKMRRIYVVVIATFALMGFQFIPSAVAADLFQWSALTSIPTAATTKSAISSDGTVIVVGKSGTGVYLSTDSGSNFTKVSAIPDGTYLVAISANGLKMFASNRNSSTVYYSTDQGVNWSTRTGVIGSSLNISSCMSGNGSVWMVGTYNGSMYTSTDNGASWQAISSLGTQYWQACWISNDGSKRLALVYDGALRYSSDSGSTWSTSATVIGGAYCVGASDDGSKVIIGSSVKWIYRSTNSGASFVSIKGTTAGVYSCASSSDGIKLIAVTSGGPIYVSNDNGANWNIETTPGTPNWFNVSMTPDGLKTIAVASNVYSTYLGLAGLPARLTLTSGNVSSMTYRASNTLSVTSNYAGLVTFFANGKKIGGCISRPTNGSLIATCNYKPAIHGAVSVTARITPSDTATAAVLQEILRTKIIVRSNPR